MAGTVAEKLTSRGQNNFNLIRLLAATGVIITHSYSLLGRPENDILAVVTKGLLSFSRLGVYVFFVISGFLVAQSFERSKTVLSFFWKRFLRILPALAAVLLSTVFILGAIVTTNSLADYFDSYSTWRYLGGLTLYRISYLLPGVFTNNPYPQAVNGSLWTLPHEWTCYVILALLLWWGKFKKEIIFLAIFILLFFRIYGDGELVDGTIPLLLLNGKQLVNFALYFFGGTLAYLYRDKIVFNKWITLFFILAFVFSVGHRLGPYLLFLVVTYFTLGLAVLPIPGRNFFDERDYSYVLYIYAFPIQQTLVYYFLPHLQVASLAVLAWLAAMPLAIISWHIIEKPCLRLKSKIL